VSTIQRPTKQGGATTYQGKVGAGYTNILASEMDADLDTIYSAWNTGVDTVNIRDGSITGSKLAPGAVGSRELADGGVATVDLADAAVTTPKLADGAVTVGKMTSVAMGGDLTGTFPNPSLATIQSGVINLAGSGRAFVAFGSLWLTMNEVGVAGSDATKASWQVVLNPVTDQFSINRAPPGSTTFTQFVHVDAGGFLYASLASGIVGRAQLNVNAIYGASALSQCPNNFVLTTPFGQWVNYMTLAPITTRGGNVMLLGEHNLSCNGPAGGGTVAQRWVRGLQPLQERAFQVGGPTAAMYVPLPGLYQLDNPAAGTYTYSMQVWVSNGNNIISSGSTQGFLQAVEVG
jgi:hypothetical protein